MGPNIMPAEWNEGGCLKVPRLSRNVLLHLAKCHPCHAKSRGAHGDTWEPSAPPEPARCHTCYACHAKWKSMCSSTIHATWNEGFKLPCLPRKVQLLPPKVQLHVPKYHACRAKSRSANGDTWELSAPPGLSQCHTCAYLPRKVLRKVRLPSKPLALPGSTTRTSSLSNENRVLNQISRSQSSATFTTHTQATRRRCACSYC